MFPVHTVCYAFTGKANGMDIVIEENEVASLKEWPESERPRMLDAIIKEVIGLAELGTFELPKLPITQKPIDSKFVLKVKYRADGTRDKSKARLVARGFQARLGVDYYSTFSPMASLTGVRALCSLAVSRGVLLMHADIPQAFIQSDLDAENSLLVFPKGIYIKDQKGKLQNIVKLRRALYGLKQSPQLWNKMLTEYLTKELLMKRKPLW